MRFDIITLFPELFAPLLSSGVTRRAYETRQVDVRLWNPRDHADGNYRRVDDRPFGGGPGMVMLAEPLEKCLQAIRADRAESEPAPLVLFSPIGQVLDHAAVQHCAESAGAVLLCGRYEGVDQRFIDRHVTRQISLGDFVLSGGRDRRHGRSAGPAQGPRCDGARAGRQPTCRALARGRTRP